MSKTIYEYDPTDIGFKELARQISIDLPLLTARVRMSRGNEDGNVEIIFPDEISAGEKTILDGIVADQKSNYIANQLAKNKTFRLAIIDFRTKELILDGFTYDSEAFSLSQEAQINAHGLMISAAGLSYPVKVTTKSDGEYSFVDAAAIAAYYGAGLTQKKTHIDSGRSLKISCNDAADQAALDLVIDNR